MRRPRRGARPRPARAGKRRGSSGDLGRRLHRHQPVRPPAGRRLILPSAGIGALDILSSAAVGGLDSVTVTVRKDPSAWKGTVAETLVDLDKLTAPHIVFDGPVREGAKLYPQNVNISAAAAI